MKKTFLVLLLTCFLGGTSMPQASEPTLTLEEIKSSTFDPPVVDEPVWQFFVNMSARNPSYHDVGSALKDLPEKLGDLCAIFRFDVEASLTGISEAAMAHDDWEPSEAVMKRTIVAYRRWGGEAQAKLIEELMPVVKKHFELAELEETEENEKKLDAIEGEYEKFQERGDKIEDQTAWEKITADVKKSPEELTIPCEKARMKHVLTALYLTFLMAACTKEDLKPVSVEQDEFIITVTATHSQPYGDVIRTLSQAVRLTVNKDRSVTDTESRRWANQPDAIQEASLKVIAALEALIEASEVHNER